MRSLRAVSFFFAAGAAAAQSISEVPLLRREEAVLGFKAVELPENPLGSGEDPRHLRCARQTGTLRLGVSGGRAGTLVLELDSAVSDARKDPNRDDGLNAWCTAQRIVYAFAPENFSPAVHNLYSSTQVAPAAAAELVRRWTALLRAEQVSSFEQLVWSRPETGRAGSAWRDAVVRNLVGVRNAVLGSTPNLESDEESGEESDEERVAYPRGGVSRA